MCKLYQEGFSALRTQLIRKQEGLYISLRSHTAAQKLDSILQECQGILILIVKQSKLGFILLVVEVYPGHALVTLSLEAVILWVKSIELMCQLVACKNVEATIHLSQYRNKALCLQLFIEI